MSVSNGKPDNKKSLDWEICIILLRNKRKNGSFYKNFNCKSAALFFKWFSDKMSCNDFIGLEMC